MPVSVHRVPHLLCCRALEVQGVRLRILRLASAEPCGRLQCEINLDYTAKILKYDFAQKTRDVRRKIFQE